MYICELFQLIYSSIRRKKLCFGNFGEAFSLMSGIHTEVTGVIIRNFKRTPQSANESLVLQSPFSFTENNKVQNTVPVLKLKFVIIKVQVLLKALICRHGLPQ